MAGFVDVTDMSDAEVKRVCQQDEGPVRNRTRQVRALPRVFDTAVMFAAAAAAYRENSHEYIKTIKTHEVNSDGEWIELATVKRLNRDIMRDYLDGTRVATDEDRALGEQVRRYYQGLQFKILAGKVLGELDAKALALACGDAVSERDIGIIAYLPAGHAVAARRQSVDERVRDATGELIGKIGDKVTITGEVVRVTWSQQWAVNFVTVITDKNEAVFFAYKREIRVGEVRKFQGTVKSHRDNQTQLNRVRAV